MTDQIPTSEILYRAADGIEAFGHMKGTGYGEGDVATAPACAIGAINRASWATGTCNMNHDAAKAAHEALRVYLPEKYIVGWNDAPERTAEEVVAALRAAAVIEAAKETADERVAVTS